MADESRKEYQLITDKIAEMKPVFDRMDEDEKLYLLDPYTMKKLGNESEKEKDVANVTLNDPLLYATKAIAIIGSYERQPVIEGQDLSDKKTTKIEQFQNDIFYLIDEWLVKRGKGSLGAFINEQVCIRGRIPARSCVRLDEEGNVIPDVLSIDARYFPYEAGEDGMIWGAGIYNRSKAQLERTYKKELEERHITLGNDLTEVRDFWNAEKEIVFIGGKILKEQPNPYGYPPFILSICPIGCMFNTKDALKHQGESIFWPNRELWKEKNRTATVLQTLSVKALTNALQLEMEHPETATKPEESPFAPDTVHAVEKGGGYRPMPINDIKNATRLFYSVLEACLQRGELTPLDYGTLAFPLSSVAILNLIAARNDIFAPRLSTIAEFCQSLTGMIIKQCVSSGKTIKLGRPGSQNTYSPSDFEGEYSIKYNFFLMSKEQTAADASLAATLKGTVPDDYIRRVIFKVQDPDGMKVQLESEQAEKLDEVLFLYRRASSLIDVSETKPEPERTKKQTEAYILAKRIVTILKQREGMGQLSPIEGKGEPEPKGKELLPLFAQGGGAGRPKTEEAQGEQQEV